MYDTVNRLKADRIRTGAGKGGGISGGGGSNKYIPAALQPMVRTLTNKPKKASPQHGSERSSSTSVTGNSSTLATTFRLFGGAKPDPQGATVTTTTEAGATADSATADSGGNAHSGATAGSHRNHADELSFSVKLRMRDKPESVRGSYDSVESDTGVQLSELTGQAGLAALLGEPQDADPLYAASQEMLAHQQMVHSQSQAQGQENHGGDLEKGEA